MLFAVVPKDLPKDLFTCVSLYLILSFFPFLSFFSFFLRFDLWWGCDGDAREGKTDVLAL